MAAPCQLCIYGAVYTGKCVQQISVAVQLGDAASVMGSLVDNVEI